MRNKVFGAIGVIWGSVALVHWLFSSQPSMSGSYQAGYYGGAVFSGVMLVAGLYYFFKKPKLGGKNRTETQKH